MSDANASETDPHGSGRRLELVTLRELTERLEDTRWAGREQALLCFSYEQTDARRSQSMAVLLEQLAQGQGLGCCGSGVIAMRGAEVLCLRGACTTRAALEFARLVRNRLQSDHDGISRASGGALSIGILPMRAGRHDSRALIERAMALCEAARRKGQSFIEVYADGDG